MRVFVAELKKLFLLFKADPKSIAAGIIAPTVILIIFALTFGNFTSLKLAFVNDDDGVYGTTLESSIFSQISPLGKNPYFEEIKTDKETAFNLYEKGKVNGVVVVGKDFSALLRDGKNTSIEYHFNNYNTDMAKNLRLYLAEGILDFYRALLVNSFSGAAVFTMASAVILWFLSGATASIKYATGILKKLLLQFPIHMD